MPRQAALEEGYKVFYVVTTEDRGFENAAMLLEAKVKEAEKDFYVELIGDAKFRDDPGRSGGGVSFGSQTARLKKKALIGTKRLK